MLTLHSFLCSFVKDEWLTSEQLAERNNDPDIEYIYYKIMWALERKLIKKRPLGGDNWRLFEYAITTKGIKESNKIREQKTSPTYVEPHSEGLPGGEKKHIQKLARWKAILEVMSDQTYVTSVSVGKASLNIYKQESIKSILSRMKAEGLVEQTSSDAMRRIALYRRTPAGREFTRGYNV